MRSRLAVLPLVLLALVVASPRATGEDAKPKLPRWKKGVQEGKVPIRVHREATLLAMERKLEDASLVESFRVVNPPNAIDHAAVKLWAVEGD